jgi:hypothetical protein
MTRKPKATSDSARNKPALSKTSDQDKPAIRRAVAQPPAPDADEADEYASPACSAHEVDPTYMMAPPRSTPPADPEQAKPAPATPQAAAPDQKPAAAKAPPPKPARGAHDQGPKPSWADRHGHAPRDQGRGRMRVGRPHGRGQGG